MFNFFSFSLPLPSGLPVFTNFIYIFKPSQMHHTSNSQIFIVHHKYLFNLSNVLDGSASAHNNAIEIRGPIVPSLSTSCFGIPWVHRAFHLSLKYMRSPECKNGLLDTPTHSSQHLFFLLHSPPPRWAFNFTRRLLPKEKQAVATLFLNEHVQSRPAFARCLML